LLALREFVENSPSGERFEWKEVAFASVSFHALKSIWRMSPPRHETRGFLFNYKISKWVPSVIIISKKKERKEKQ
jgi:hypothetical protein